MSQTYNIRLDVERDGDEYAASWVEPGGEQSNPFTMVLPLRQQDISDLRQFRPGYLEL